MKNKYKNSLTLDLKEINAKEYLKNKKMIKNRLRLQKLRKYKDIFKFAVCSLVLFLIITVGLLIPKSTNAFSNNGSLCQNLYMSNNVQGLISYDCDIQAISTIIDNVKTKSIETETQGFYTTIQWGRYKQPIQVFDTQVNEMIKKWLKLTRILDLLTLKTNECNRYDWRCFNWNDVGHFQINKIHKLQYIKSHELFYNGWELFLYQLDYADALVQSYMDRFCDWKWSWSNERRFKCVARSYNWNKAIWSNWKELRQNYAELWWAKRQIISKYIVENFPKLKN